MIKTARKKIENELGVVDKIELLPEQGSTSEVYKIIIANQTYVLKLSTDFRYRQWLKQEAEVMKKYEGCELPIPTCYLFFEEGNISYLVMSYYEGQSLTKALQEGSLVEQQRLIKEFGVLLRSLHEYVCEGTNDWLQQQLNLSQVYLDTGTLIGLQDLLNQLREKAPAPIVSSLIHGDCTTDNVLVVDGKVCYFIDLAAMTVGDARYDLALAIRNFNPQQKKIFYEGYKLRKLTDMEYSYFEQGLYEFF